MEKQCLCYVFVLCLCVVTGELHLRLESLHCIETEDYTGSDNITINRRQDRYDWQKVLKTTIKEGQYRYFKNQSSNFKKYLYIQLIEEDYGPDDDMGEFTIDRNNIGEQYKHLDALGRGEYTLTWTDLTPFYSKIKEKHKKINPNNDVSRRSSEHRKEKMKEYVDKNLQKSKAIAKEIKKHFDEEDRKKKTHEAVVKTVHTFKTTKSTDSLRSDVVRFLKRVINFTPLRSIFQQNVEMGNWPTIIIYGMFSPLNFIFADIVGALGVALEMNGEGAAIVFLAGADLGFTPGDEAQISIGLNRNPIANLSGFTYYYTEPSDNTILGGMTYSFNMNTETPDLQEVEYSFGLVGHSIGFAYTGVLRLP